jgi:hypothetical protein
MTRPRRQRSDSVAASIDAHQVVRMPIEPPEPIPERCRPLWDDIVVMRSSFEWTPLDLHLLVALVLALAGLEEQQSALSRENLLRRTKHGLAPNPRLELVERLQRRVLALQSRLLLDPRAFGHRSDRTAAARKLEHDARQTVSLADEFRPSRRFLAGPDDDPIAQLLAHDDDLLPPH